VACTYGTTTWKGLNAGAKVIAASALDLLTKPAELKKIRDEFEAYIKTYPYKSFLPADAQPPLDINENLMNKYRALLEKAAEIKK
jgi:aminobenzoyl-glutamate utilization protein B